MVQVAVSVPTLSDGSGRCKRPDPAVSAPTLSATAIRVLSAPAPLSATANV